MKKNIGKILLIVLPIVAAALILYPTYTASELEEVKQNFLTFTDVDSSKVDSIYNLKLETHENPDEEMKAMVKDSAVKFVLKQKDKEFKEQYGQEYEDAKSSRLKLGLDLRGGMYVTLEVDVVKLIEEAAIKDAVDEVFEQVIEETRKATENSSKDVIEVFLQKFNEIAKTQEMHLSDYFDYRMGSDDGDEEANIVDKLRANEEEAIDRSQQIIRQRVDKYGIAEPSIQKQGTRRIMLELPGVTNEEEMSSLIKTTARLEFHLVKNNADLFNAFYKIDQLLAKEQGLDIDEEVVEAVAGDSLENDTTAADSLAEETVENTEETVDTTAVVETDSTVAAEGDSTVAEDTAAIEDTAAEEELTEDEAYKKYTTEHPFTMLFVTYFSVDNKTQSRPVDYRPENLNLQGEYNFMIADDKLDEFYLILERPDVKELLPDNIVIYNDAEPEIDKKSKTKYYNFYALKSEPELSGDVVSSAREDYDPTNNKPVVYMGMNSDGADKWSRITGANVNKRIAIVLDKAVYSAPNVITKITGGQSSITGMKNIQEAKLLRIVLKAGALKAPVKIIEELVVGPSLGEDAINSGLNSSMIAFILVILYMIMYYNRAGFIADFALLLNVLLIISIVAAFKGTLTLPGIAGIILTIGMAVDANILIFERIREELYKGRSLRSAVDEGFSKALSAILDSNITTFITGLILYFLGTGPIQGFALTLMIGIFGTLFTGIVISRAMIEVSLSKGAKSFSFGQPKDFKI